MENCIFCKIANKEVPANIVYEDEDFVAFLDINPISPGHCMVIPKAHYRWVWDLPSQSFGKASVPDIGEYFRVVQKIARAQQKAFGTDQILSKVVGEDVPHAHIWVYPNKNAEGDPKDFESNAKKIRQNLD